MWIVSQEWVAMFNLQHNHRFDELSKSACIQNSSTEPSALCSKCRKWDRLRFDKFHIIHAGCENTASIKLLQTDPRLVSNVCLWLPFSILVFRYDQLFDYAQIRLKSLIDQIRLDRQCDRDQVLDLTVSIDGTWKKRGHQSMYGIVFLIEADSGFCIDFETLSTRCEMCESKQRSLKAGQFRKWVRSTNFIVRRRWILLFSTYLINQNVQRTGTVQQVEWRKKVLNGSSNVQLKRVEFWNEWSMVRISF